MEWLPLTHHPVNRQAGLVGARGEHFEFQVPETLVHTFAPPPIRELPKVSLTTLPNLVGKKIGRLTVIGLARDVKKRWVVRCTCGWYEMRSTKALQSSDGNNAKCAECRKTEYLREGKNQ